MQLQDLQQLARPLKQRWRIPLTNWTDSGWAEDNRMELYNLELIQEVKGNDGRRQKAGRIEFSWNTGPVHFVFYIKNIFISKIWCL